METAEAILAAVGRWPLAISFIFRAGVWKPRTRPDTFQGAGEEGLKWLQEVKARFGVPVATEVATPEHVQAALQAGIDYLWIGARSSATPIVVQAIADAIADRYAAGLLQSKTADAARPASPKGILIKNPVNADAALWLGNIARLEKTGVPVMAIHRGCNHKPCWSMAHAVRTARPDIPMLLDPSHMSGDAARVPVLLDKIAELGLDGAMVEIHHDPASALSDRQQQITPEAFRSWYTPSTCRVRVEYVSSSCMEAKREENGSKTEATTLNWLRAEIDELDEQLWETIASRMDVSRRIGEWKKAQGVAPLQPERFRQIVERVQKTAEEKGLSAPFAEKVWELIHEESLRKQR